MILVAIIWGLSIIFLLVFYHKVFKTSLSFQELLGFALYAPILLYCALIYLIYEGWNKPVMKARKPKAKS